MGGKNVFCFLTTLEESDTCTRWGMSPCAKGSESRRPFDSPGNILYFGNLIDNLVKFREEVRR
jgi:hypothetical protein